MAAFPKLVAVKLIVIVVGKATSLDQHRLHEPLVGLPRFELRRVAGLSRWALFARLVGRSRIEISVVWIFGLRIFFEFFIEVVFLTELFVELFSGIWLMPDCWAWINKPTSACRNR